MKKQNNLTINNQLNNAHLNFAWPFLSVKVGHSFSLLLLIIFAILGSTVFSQAQTFVGSTGVINDFTAGPPCPSNSFIAPVSGVGTGNVTNVNLDITHTWAQDLDIYIVSPSNTRIILSSDNGGSSSSYIVTEFKDGGVNGSITTAPTPFTGSYIAEEALSIFDGENMNGNWTLEVCDDEAGIDGTLDSWSISVVSSGPTCSVNISDVTTTAETCPGQNDGSLTVVATCAGCVGVIIYNIDGGFFQLSPSFSGLSDGTHIVVARDNGNASCSDTNSGTIASGSYDSAVTLDGSGNLDITDPIGDSDDVINLSVSGTDLRVNDTNLCLNGTGIGVVQVDGNTVDVPMASLTGDLNVMGMGGTDELNIDGTIVIGGAFTADCEKINCKDGSFINAAGGTTMTGTIAPGNSPGIMTVLAPYTITCGSTLEIEMRSATAGIEGYDQIVVTGSDDINISGVHLKLSDCYTPELGDTFTIINNQTGGPIVGHFSGLIEGAEIKYNGTDLRLSYTGGDGNDIVLTAVDNTATSYINNKDLGASFNAMAASNSINNCHEE